MAPIYKYLNRNHLLKFREHGLVLINTLHKLRYEHEKIRDEYEGRSQLKVGSKHDTLTFTGEEFHRLFPKIKSDKPNIEIQLDRGAFIVDSREVSDAFVFCASLKLDDSLCRKFGYDAHYKIVDPDRFAEIVYEKLNEVRTITCFKADKVKYSIKQVVLTKKKKSPSETLTDFWEICFTKPEKFRDEKEFRIVFVPEYPKEISPLILRCPELRKCCQF
jgi:hypothetical protein